MTTLFDLHKATTRDIKSIFDHAEELLRSTQKQMEVKWPPFDVIKTDENKYVIRLAVAGFGEQDIEIDVSGDVLTVKADAKKTETDEEVIYKGIANRGFVRAWTLNDKVEVKNATLVNGMLSVYLEKMKEINDSFKVPINGKQTLLNE